MRFRRRHVVLLVLVVHIVAVGQTSLPSRLFLDFEGNKVFSKTELLTVTEKCLAASPHWNDSHNPQILDYCLARLQLFLSAKGYLQSSVGKPLKQQSENGLSLIILIVEGPLYRLGEVEIKDSKLWSPSQIREMLDLKKGDVADSDRIDVWLQDRVGNAYKNFGYMQYSSEVDPKFHLKSGATEGVVDLKVTIDEGNVFTIRSIRFEGNGNVPEDALKRKLLLSTGEIYSKELFDESLKRINHTGQFEPIDSDRDVDYRSDWKDTQLDLIIRLKGKPAKSPLL